MDDQPASLPRYSSPVGAYRPGPSVAPRPPSRLAVELGAFWQGARSTPTPVVLGTCAAVGLAGGGLLVGYRPGLGVAITAALMWAAAAPELLRRRGLGDLVTACLATALVAVVAVRDAAWVVVLCALVAVVLAAVAATGARSTPAVLLAPPTGLAGVLRALPWLRRGVAAAAGRRRGQVRVAVRSLALTVVLLGVFGALFASADRVFASYLPTVDLGLLPARVVVGALVALAAAVLAHLALAPPGWSSARLPAAPPARRAEWLLPVVALDVLVLAFVLVQVGALVGGHRFVSATAGLSYAQYAREGFAQLVVATALTLVVVAVAARRAPRAEARDRIVSRVALAVLCLGTLGVVASALRRMDLYMDAFGLTRLRMLVVVLEVVMGVVLVLVLVAGARGRGNWLPRAVVQLVAVAMLGLAVVNPDARIAQHNTTADLDTGVDVSYLQGLSADAVPQLDRLPEPLRSCVLAGTATDAASRPAEGVAGWNLGRERAAAVLREGAPVGGGAAACSQHHGAP